jgi:hypothetical protein
LPRWAPLGALVFSVTLAGLWVTQAIARRRVDAEIMPLAGPYLGKGFAMIPTPVFGQESLVLVADHPTCFVALAARGKAGGPVAVERPAGTTRGEGSLGWCTCGEEQARVSAAGSDGVRVLRAESSEVGGDFGLLLLSPKPSALSAPGPCAAREFDGSLAARKVDAHASDTALAAPVRRNLAESGFSPVASAAPDVPLALVPVEKDACILAWGTDPEATLGFDLLTGEMPLAKVRGAIGVCSENGLHLLVRREGRGFLIVERVLAARIGGTLGLHEVTQRILSLPVSSWVGASDLDWDAAATLRAAKISAPEIEFPKDGHPVPQARLVALSTDGAPTGPEGDPAEPYMCEPKLGPGVQGALCAQASPLGWRVGQTGPTRGVAAAALPFWMQPFESAIEPTVLGAELAMAKLARGLTAKGFEPTILEGTIELDDAITVMGRPGEDAIVAVDLIREPPWAFPCTDGPPWDLAGEPRRVPVLAGVKKTLSCPRARGASREQGNAVVFRHRAGE